ncbi:MAG: hypothetical protein ABI036_01435 [Fibrobacteria bacterium]
MFQFGKINSTSASSFRIVDLFNNQERLRLDINGNVGIGTTTAPAERLEVSGKVKATDFIATNSIKIKNWTIDAPDFVFEKGYKVRSLQEVERHIRSRKHLPEMPSAEEFKDKGVDILEMNYKLLQKVEELTLYAIEQEKRIKKLESFAHVEGWETQNRQARVP